MPSGKTHLRIELSLWAAGVALTPHLVVTGRISWQTALSFWLAYLFSALFLSPDLDLSTSRAFRRWGIARLLWLPYAKLTRHRGASHRLFLGPLTRVLYLAGILVIALTAISLLIRRPRAWSPALWLLAGPALVGIFVPNQIHILVDLLTSSLPRRRRR
jgi:uncharacterized metal-binding protein